MTFPKSALFSEEDQSISRISFALGHPARLFIARTLWTEGSLHVQDLEKVMPLVQASISHHLKTMRLTGLVNVHEERLFNRYQLNQERMHELAVEYDKWFNSFHRM